MKNYLVFLVFMFCISYTQAQQYNELIINELDSISDELIQQQAFQKAVPYTLELLAKSKNTDDNTLSNSLKKLAMLYKYLGQYEAAEPLYLQSIDLLKKNVGEEDPLYAKALSSLASLYYFMGKVEETESTLLKILEIRKKTLGESNPDYANTLSNLSEFYRSLERFADAEPLAMQAVAVLKKDSAVSPIAYSSALSNLASIYNETMRLIEAESSYMDALKILRDNKETDSDIYVITLNNLALLYRKMSRYEEAIGLMKKVIAIDKKVLGVTHSEYASDLHNLASFYRFAQRYEEAEPLYFEALKIWQTSLSESHPSNLIGLNAITNLYKEWGRYDVALQYVQKAILANSKTKDSSAIHNMAKITEMQFYSDLYISETLNNYYQICKKMAEAGNAAYLDTAYRVLQSSIVMNERVRNNFSSEGDKYRTLSNINDLVQKTIEMALWLDRPSMQAELFSYSELNKSILLADATKAARARTLGDLPDSLVLVELALQEASDELKRAEAETDVAAQKLLLTQKLNETNLQIEAFKKLLESKYPKYFKLKYANITASAEDVQQLLDGQTAFLEYFITDSLTYLFFLTKDKIQLYPLALTKSVLTEQISKLRKVLSDYEFIVKNQEEAYQIYVNNAYFLYKTLLAPALEGKDIQKLIIVADGELGHLPFEAFLTEEMKSVKNYAALPYLLNKYSVSYNYSATLWKENLEHPIKNSNGKMLGVAASYKRVDEDNSVRANRAPQLRNLRDALQDLPAAKEEVQALSKLFDGDFWFEEGANEAAFKANAGDYGIIHLAMHGLLNQRAPILSSLAFSENSDSTEDNFLEAWEIAHLKLNAQLVVLSACETGYGKFQQGEGVMSLARSFMYAGVPSLVVSMWQVNDASTSLIMQFFYKNLAKGMDKATALQQAKLEYIGGVDGDGGDGITGGDGINRVSIAAHPAFWAPFVQLGDFRPIKISQKSSGFWWAGGIVLGVLVLGGLGFLLKRKKSG